MPILAQQDPVFQPAMRVISSITNSSPAIVTTTFDHDYITGTIIRLHIPKGFGMTQANTLTGTINVTGSNTFSVDIDTTNFDIFAAPTSFPDDRQYAQVTAIGEVNEITSASERNVLPY